MTQTVIQIGSFSYFSNKIIGRGATGCVYMGFRNLDKLPAAVKVIKLQQIDSSVKKHLLDCEISGLLAIKGRYVCQTYDIFKNDEFYYVPMELCPHGTLRDYIKSKCINLYNLAKLKEKEVLSIFERIFEGYFSIYKCGFLHRDLKTENILMRQNMQPAIIDMGYCQKIETQNKRLTYNVGSPAYMSPQAYNDNIYSQKSDVWALGIILHEMLTGTIPVMRTSNIDEYFLNLKNMRNAQIIKCTENQKINNLLQGCLTVDMKMRFGVNDIQRVLKSSSLETPLSRVKSLSSLESIYQKQNFNVKIEKPVSTYYQNNNFKKNSQKRVENHQRNPTLNLNQQRNMKFQEMALQKQNVQFMVKNEDKFLQRQNRFSFKTSEMTSVVQMPMTKKQNLQNMQACKQQINFQKSQLSPKVVFGQWNQNQGFDMNNKGNGLMKQQFNKITDVRNMNKDRINGNVIYPLHQNQNVSSQIAEKDKFEVEQRLRKAVSIHCSNPNQLNRC